MNNFYVYIHYRFSDGEPFYIGKGSGKRAYVKSGRNSHWYNTYRKHGRIVEIVKENLTEAEAYDLEKQYIKNFRLQFDCLCNKTDGGDGCQGIKVSADTRKKLSLKHKGRVKSQSELDNIRIAAKLRRGVRKSAEQVEKMRKAQTGKKHSDSTKKKMQMTRLNGRCNIDHSIYTFFSATDVFIGKRWELARHVGLPAKKFRPLFDKQRQKICQGWSLLRLNEFLILKDIFL